MPHYKLGCGEETFLPTLQKHNGFSRIMRQEGGRCGTYHLQGFLACFIHLFHFESLNLRISHTYHKTIRASPLLRIIFKLFLSVKFHDPLHQMCHTQKPYVWVYGQLIFWVEVLTQCYLVNCTLTLFTFKPYHNFFFHVIK